MAPVPATGSQTPGGAPAQPNGEHRPSSPPIVSPLHSCCGLHPGLTCRITSRWRRPIVCKLPRCVADSVAPAVRPFEGRHCPAGRGESRPHTHSSTVLAATGAIFPTHSFFFQPEQLSFPHFWPVWGVCDSRFSQPSLPRGSSRRPRPPPEHPRSPARRATQRRNRQRGAAPDRPWQHC